MTASNAVKAVNNIYLYTRIYEMPDCVGRGNLRFYTGITRNIDRRQREHNNNVGCRTTTRYNKSYKLLNIYYIDTLCRNFKDAQRLETKFRKCSNDKKLRIIKSIWTRWQE